MLYDNIFFTQVTRGTFSDRVIVTLGLLCFQVRLYAVHMSTIIIVCRTRLISYGDITFHYIPVVVEYTTYNIHKAREMKNVDQAIFDLFHSNILMIFVSLCSVVYPRMDRL